MNRNRRWATIHWLSKIDGDWWIDEPWTNRLLSSQRQDRLSEWLERHFTDPVARLLCRRFGHFPMADHCGMPAHDYCLGCGASTPDQAERRAP